MGDIAEMMLDGTLCESCGEFIGEPVGYPQYCDSCGDPNEDYYQKQKRIIKQRKRKAKNRKMKKTENKAIKNVETTEIMTEIKQVEKKFKQMKARANELCQQGNHKEAKDLLKKMKRIVE